MRPDSEAKQAILVLLSAQVEAAPAGLCSPYPAQSTPDIDMYAIIAVLVLLLSLKSSSKATYCSCCPVTCPQLRWSCVIRSKVPEASVEDDLVSDLAKLHVTSDFTTPPLTATEPSVQEIGPLLQLHAAIQREGERLCRTSFETPSGTGILIIFSLYIVHCT